MKNAPTPPIVARSSTNRTDTVHHHRIPATRRPDIRAVDLPGTARVAVPTGLAELLAAEEQPRTRNGTKREAEETQQRIGQLVLDDAIAIAIALSRTFAVWGTAPEITIEPNIVHWPPLLDNTQLVG